MVVGVYIEKILILYVVGMVIIIVISNMNRDLPSKLHVLNI